MKNDNASSAKMAADGTSCQCQCEIVNAFHLWDFWENTWGSKTGLHLSGVGVIYRCAVMPRFNLHARLHMHTNYSVWQECVLLREISSHKKFGGCKGQPLAVPTV